MLVSLNNIDITDHISESSYKVNSEDSYENWLDGNFREHRIVTRQRISGKFEIALYGRDGWTTKKFLAEWKKATKNNVVNLVVYVCNEDRYANIEAFYEIAGKKHLQLSSGAYLDVLTVTLEER